MADINAELTARLLSALRPSARLTVHETAKELGAVRKEAAKLGLDYNALLVEACKQLKAEKKAMGNDLEGKLRRPS